MAQVTGFVCDICGRALKGKIGLYAVRFRDTEGLEHALDACKPQCLRKASVIAGRDFGAIKCEDFTAYNVRLDTYNPTQYTVDGFVEA